MPVKEIHTTEDNGVTVTKFLDIDASNTVQIGFQIDSTRGDPVTVRVVDPILPERDIQVPSVDHERWTITERAVEYDRTLHREETVTTAYTFTSDDPADVAESQPAPSLVVDGKTESAEPEVKTESAEPRTESESAEMGTESKPFTRGASGAVVAFDGDDVPGSATSPDANRDVNAKQVDDRERGPVGGNVQESIGEFAMPDDEMFLADLVGEPSDGQDGGADDPATSEQSCRSNATAEANGTDAAVETLIAALERDLSTDQRERLQSALAEAVRPRSSLEVQVRHLQSRFEKLAAYTDALEEFLDENGAAEDVLQELTDELETLRSEFDELQDGQADVETRLADVESNLANVQSELESRQTSVEDDLAALENSYATPEETQGTLQERLEEFTAFQKTMRNALQVAPAQSE